MEKLIELLKLLSKEVELRLKYKGEVTKFEVTLRGEVDFLIKELGLHD